jgi:murein DD-endopeptidase MepM/ murein hydrolase activator NlpD
VALAGLVVVLGWLAVTVAGSAAAPQAADGAVTFRPPVPGPLHVLHPFVAPPQPWSAGHRGVDLAADAGAALVAPAGGVVTFAGEVVGRGVVTITHPGGLRSSLEPVVATVAVGDVVGAGDVVGSVGGTGSHCAAAACVHWGVRRGTTYLDPLGTLGSPGPVVLLQDARVDTSTLSSTGTGLEERP